MDRQNFSEMIDIHNHILPNVDDGAKSFEMSIKMLKHAHHQGVTEIVNTIHYQHPLFMNIDFSVQRLEKLKNSIQLKLNELDIDLKIHLGCEVFYYDNLLKIKDEPFITIGKGKFMLIEFSPNNIPNSQKQTLFDLKMNGITPIIAHPERYKKVQNDLNIIFDWINAGCIIQVDSGSVLGFLGKKAKETSLAIIKENCCHVLASDAHNDTNRNFCIKKSYEIAKNIVGAEQAYRLVMEHPYSITRGEDLYF